VRGLQCISDRVNRAADLETLLHNVLEALDDYFHFSHTSVLLFEEANQQLVTLASRGYGESGVGAEVPVGQDVIGTVARERRVLRLTNLEADLDYARAIRREAQAERGGPALKMEGKSDDAIFVDDEYLIRNVPARILWKVLRKSQRTGRTKFSNRELRLDAWLGLPRSRRTSKAA